MASTSSCLLIDERPGTSRRCASPYRCDLLAFASTPPAVLDPSAESWAVSLAACASLGPSRPSVSVGGQRVDPCLGEPHVHLSKGRARPLEAADCGERGVAVVGVGDLAGGLPTLLVDADQSTATELAWRTDVLQRLGTRCCGRSAPRHRAPPRASTRTPAQGHRYRRCTACGCAGRCGSAGRAGTTCRTGWCRTAPPARAERPGPPSVGRAAGRRKRRRP